MNAILEPLRYVFFVRGLIGLSLVVVLKGHSYIGDAMARAVFLGVGSAIGVGTAQLPSRHTRRGNRQDCQHSRLRHHPALEAKRPQSSSSVNGLLLTFT